MAETLDYQRRIPNQPRPAIGRALAVSSLLTIVCFAMPFGLYYLPDLLGPGRQEYAAYALLLPMLMLWLGSGIFGLCAVVAGVVALRHQGPRFWTIAATAASATIIAIELVAVAAGFLRTLRGG